MAKKKKTPRWECIAEREFYGNIVITDPCYLNERHMHWEELEAWAKEHGLCNQTYYGDWGCTVFKADRAVGASYKKSASIGEFCADSGTVCVLYMLDATSLFPGVEEWIASHGWCATVIKGFSGVVRLMTLTTTRRMNVSRFTPEVKKNLGIKGNWMTYDDVDLRVRGDGTLNGDPFSFESYQTSL